MSSADLDPKKWMFTRLKMRAWRNFTSSVEARLGGRVFFIGPNASGKSNILDALRFLRDVATMGLQKSVAARGRMAEIRSLHAQAGPGVELSVEIGTEARPEIFSYELIFRNHPHRHHPVVFKEVVRHENKIVLNRPTAAEKNDVELLKQTHLEQATANQNFRPLSKFLSSVRYLHLVPQLVRQPDRLEARSNDPYGADFLARIATTREPTRKARLRRIQKALQVAVPNFSSFELDRDVRGNWHLLANYNHWRSRDVQQNESTFSDGTLRLMGFLWALEESGGPLLLEEPELGLHDKLVAQFPALMARMHRKFHRQALITTHSTALLRDDGIGLDEVYLLFPEKAGTVLRCAAEIDHLRALVAAKIPLGDALMPTVAPPNAEPFGLWER